MQRSTRFVNRLAYTLCALFAADRLIKLWAVVAFFRRHAPPDPAPWPSVTLLQPITQGASGLRGNLLARSRLDYPAALQHLLICDGHDHESQALCQAWIAANPQLQVSLVLVAGEGMGIASKIDKLQAALTHATGDVLCFIDDDVAPRPEALRGLVRYLYQRGAGATFGIACYTNWRSPWSSLMSAFVNANALLSYIPLTFMTDPFTITGHFFALRRADFVAVRGLEGMQQNIGDDHELARRVRQHGLRIVQTPVIYDVDNHFPSLRSYAIQMKRWFVFPRQVMLPLMSGRDRLATTVGSLGNLVPGLLMLLALLTGRRTAWAALGVSMGSFATVYAFCERRYLRHRMPLCRWPLLAAVATITPIQIIWALCSNNEVIWRGRRIRVYRGGRFEEWIMPRREIQTMAIDKHAQFAQFRATHRFSQRQIGNARWDYIACGHGENTLLLLPGGLATGETCFQYTLAFEDRFRIVAPSYPSELTTVADVVDGLAGLLLAEGIGQAHVVGGSYSGLVAQCLVRRHPALVQSLMLTNTGIARPQRAKLARVLRVAFAMVPYKVLRRLMKLSIRSFLPERSATQSFWRDYFSELIDSLTRADYLSRLDVAIDIDSHYTFGAADIQGWTGGILLVDADADRMFPPAERAALKALYPQAQSHSLVGQRHNASLDRPEHTIALIAQFLREQQRNAAPCPSEQPACISPS